MKFTHLKCNRHSHYFRSYHVRIYRFLEKKREEPISAVPGRLTRNPSIWLTFSCLNLQLIYALIAVSHCLCSKSSVIQFLNSKSILEHLCHRKSKHSTANYVFFLENTLLSIPFSILVNNNVHFEFCRAKNNETFGILVFLEL